MEKKPISSVPASNAPKKPVLVKRIKVPVKRPVAPASAPTPSPVQEAPAPKTVLTKIPVKKIIKVPVKRPVQPAAPAPTPVPAPQPPAAHASVRPAQKPVPTPQKIPEAEFAQALQKQPKPVIVSNTATPSQRSKRTRSKDDEWVNYVLPENPLSKITAHESTRERFFLFYVYVRLYAEELLDEEEFVSLPPFAFDLPQTKRDLKIFKKQLRSNAQEGMMDDILDDLTTILPLIPEMQRILDRNLPLDNLIEEEIEYMEESEDSSIGEQLVVSYLLVMADMEIMLKKAQSRRMREERENLIEEIQDNENEELEIQKAFINALKKENFPIDAEKLIRNYFNFARKEPEKAYQLLTTNPLFFAPVQTEKLPKKFFGLVKAGPKEASAVNKRLASFLKRVKI